MNYISDYSGRPLVMAVAHDIGAILALDRVCPSSVETPATRSHNNRKEKEASRMAEEQRLEARPDNSDAASSHPPKPNKTGDERVPPCDLNGYRLETLDAFHNA
jgi:hypothetical protein